MDTYTLLIRSVFVAFCCTSAHAQVHPLSHPAVSALAFSSDSKVLASAGRDGIRLWDVRSEELLTTLRGHKILNPCGPGELWATTGLKFVAKDTLLSSGKDGNIHLWDIRDGSLRRSIAEPWVYRFAGADSLTWLRRVPVDAVAVSSDQQYVAACMFGTVQTWKLSTGEHVRTYGAEPLRTESMVVEGLVPPSQKAVAADWKQKFLCEFLEFPDRNALPAELQRWRTARPVLDDLRHVAITPDLRRIVAAGPRGVYVWDFRSGELQFKVDNVSYFDVSPDSKVLITSDRFGPIQVWNLSTARLVRTIADRCRGVQFLPNGRSFITASSEALSQWSIDKWSKERSFPDQSPGGSPEVFVVSPTSDLLAATWSRWDERRIRIWRLDAED